jgi:hypothetical protein
MTPDSENGPVDISNMGRCVVCGRTIDMRDEDETLVVMEQTVPDHPDVDKQDVRAAMVRALSHEESPENYSLKQAYEDGEEIVMHEECHDKTSLPDMYATKPILEEIENDD